MINTEFEDKSSSKTSLVLSPPTPSSLNPLPNKKNEKYNNSLNKHE